METITNVWNGIMDFFRRMFSATTPEASVADRVQPSTQTDDAEDDDITQELANKRASEQTPAPEDAVTKLEDETDDKPTIPINLGKEVVTRPLPSEPNLPIPKGHIVYGQASDKGMVRSNNQDTVVSFFFKSDSVDDHPDFGVFVVADGMGGHHDGEKASAITGRIVVSELLNSIYLPLIHGDDLNSVDRPTIAEALTEAVQRANTVVRKEVPEGGTTITALVIMSNFGHIAHVGDSRAYLITQKGIEQVTRDHSLVERLKELGQLTSEEAATHDQRNVLYRAIGQSEELEVDTRTLRLPTNAHLLICSDGLWGLIEETEILEIARNTQDPQEACEKLVALANTKGGTDNISAMLLKMPAN